MRTISRLSTSYIYGFSSLELLKCLNETKCIEIIVNVQINTIFISIDIKLPMFPIYFECIKNKIHF